jgi:thiamine-monophosphate kinase
MGTTSEFALIDRYFTRAPRRARLGVGDDCALLTLPAGLELAVSTDTLVEGTHFLPGADALWLGHKALAVNLSDLAAMGAEPHAALLALTLPAVDEAWLCAFARGFFALAERHEVELLGGDTTRGPLSITLTVLGTVPAGAAVTRSGARDGDDLWVSGELGGAALGLLHATGQIELAADLQAGPSARLHQPWPRLELGIALRGVATAMIDVSDGLIADVGHLCERSGLDATIDWDAVPRAAELRAQAEPVRRHCALAGGDDYELAFCAPVMRRAMLEGLQAGVPLTRIGRMHAGGTGVHVEAGGERIAIDCAGFDHFSAAMRPSPKP